MTPSSLFPGAASVTCSAAPLLVPSAAALLASQFARYDPVYDELFWEVHSRITATGHATKADIGALIFWKHIQTARWMTDLMLTPDKAVKVATTAAFARKRRDTQRLQALATLSGCASAGPTSTVLLAAFDPTTYGVCDKLAVKVLPKVLSSVCRCIASNTATHPSHQKTTTYLEHLRVMAIELNASGGAWTPRAVDMALFKLGGG